MTGAVTRRWWALGAMVLAVLTVTLDITVLTVALPTLAGALKASESQLQWFVTAYTLALVAGMLPAGLIGDRYGRKGLLVGALILFAAGSLGCAYAPSPDVFLVARVVLGLAGAALIVTVLSLLTVLFSEAERPRAVGIWGAANFVGLPLGPIIGGWLLTNFWWGWIFLMNVPVALLALVAVLVLVPNSRSAERPGIDLLGVLLSSAGLVALMYGVVEAGSNGWGSASALVPAVVGLVVLAGFVFWERWLSARPGLQPLVDLRLFRSRSFTWGTICTAFGVFALFGVMFALPQYFQAILRVNPQGSGFRLLPLVAGLIVGTVPADRVAGWLGTKLTVAIGFAVAAAGCFIGMGMTATSGDGFMAAWTVVVGAGAGLGFATAASAALVEVSADRSGVASALLQAVIKLGPAFGASILGSVLNSTYQAQVQVASLPPTLAATVKVSVFSGLAVAQKLGSPALLDSVRTSFVAGIDDAVRLTTGVAVAAIVLALLFLPSHKRVGAMDAAAPVATRVAASESER
jgi:DHA2 family multidrug resistance protein-like MFS transporter